MHNTDSKRHDCVLAGCCAGLAESEENLDFNATCQAILGDRHFLGAGHTFQAMERDYHYPKLADREQCKTWADVGALNAWDRARTKARETLAQDTGGCLTAEQAAKIKAQFEVSEV